MENITEKDVIEVKKIVEQGYEIIPEIAGKVLTFGKERKLVVLKKDFEKYYKKGE